MQGVCTCDAQRGCVCTCARGIHRWGCVHMGGECTRGCRGVCLCVHVGVQGRVHAQGGARRGVHVCRGCTSTGTRVCLCKRGTRTHTGVLAWVCLGGHMHTGEQGAHTRGVHTCWGICVHWMHHCHPQNCHSCHPVSPTVTQRDAPAGSDPPTNPGPSRDTRVLSPAPSAGTFPRRSQLWGPGGTGKVLPVFSLLSPDLEPVDEGTC